MHFLSLRSSFSLSLTTTHSHISVTPQKRDEIGQEIVCITLMWEAQN
jgi:hypothetical protein